MHSNQDNVIPFGSNYPVSGLPPQNIEAEEAILGGIMLDPEAMTRVSDRLSVDAFYISAHKDIYQAAVRLHATYQPTDLLSVTAWLADHNLLNRIGGRNKLATLVDRTVSAVNIDALAAAILILKKNKRKFSYLHRELMSNHHFLTDNYHPTLEIDRFLKICP